jgi:hypothetical protein
MLDPTSIDSSMPTAGGLAGALPDILCQLIG